MYLVFGSASLYEMEKQIPPSDGQRSSVLEPYKTLKRPAEYLDELRVVPIIKLLVLLGVV